MLCTVTLHCHFLWQASQTSTVWPNGPRLPVLYMLAPVWKSLQGHIIAIGLISQVSLYEASLPLQNRMLNMPIQLKQQWPCAATALQATMEINIAVLHDESPGRPSWLPLGHQ